MKFYQNLRFFLKKKSQPLQLTFAGSSQEKDNMVLLKIWRKKTQILVSVLPLASPGILHLLEGIDCVLIFVCLEFRV